MVKILSHEDGVDVVLGLQAVTHEVTGDFDIHRGTDGEGRSVTVAFGPLSGTALVVTTG